MSDNPAASEPPESGNVVPLRKPSNSPTGNPPASPSGSLVADGTGTAGPAGTGQRSDTSYEIELDDQPDPGPPVPVDTVESVDGPFDRAMDGLREIIPPGLRRGNLAASTRRVLGRWWHQVRYHAVRSPWYAAQAVFWSVAGVGKLAGAQLRWWWLSEQHGLRSYAASSNDAQTWMRLHREVKITRRWRGVILVAEAILTAAAVAVGWWLAPLWLRTIGVVGLVCWLAHLGRPADRPIVSAAVVAQRYRKLNADIVLRAYYAAGLGKPDKPDQQIQFGSALGRNARNTGSQVVIDVPHGKTWSDVLAAKEKIASGLDVHVNQVFLTADKSSSRRHTLFVSDRDPLAVKVGKTDMLDCKPRNIWRPVRFGKDEHGALVELCLMWISVLVGAQPRKGKTFSARLLALHAALDPWVKLVIVDGKMSPDWMKFQLVAHRFIYGTHPNPTDPDPIGHLLATLDEILAHINRVNEKLATLPVELCPEGKLTEQLARDPRYPDLRVLVLVVEEFQVFFETEDQQVNKDIANKLSRIQAVGPSAGVIPISLSQKPSGVGAGDVSRLFNRYRDNHTARFALRCGNRIVSEAVLGGDAYTEGFDASTLPLGDEYRGIGYLYGLTDHVPTVRTFLADHPDAEKILTAARKHREALGTLTGEAAGEDLQRDTRDMLADALSVFMPGDKALAWEELAPRLADRYPEQYTDVTAEAVSAQLRALSVPSVDVKRNRRSLKGTRREHIETAMTQRDQNRDDDQPDNETEPGTLREDGPEQEAV